MSTGVVVVVVFGMICLTLVVLVKMVSPKDEDEAHERCPFCLGDPGTYQNGLDHDRSGG